jgi:hypothetical protein
MMREPHTGAAKSAAQLLYMLTVAFPTWGGAVAAIYTLLLFSGISTALRRVWQS